MNTKKTQTLIRALLVGGILVLVNFISIRIFTRLDLTEQKVFTLAEASKKLVGSLNDRVTVKAYFTEDLPAPYNNNRRAVLDKLKAKRIPAILVPEPEVAFQILALNTEKAHNLKEKSLEVIRMCKGLAKEQPRASEEDFVFQFESAHFITLGLLYEKNRRFAGGAFAPILRRVDKLLKLTLPRALEERQERADLVREADEALSDIVAKIKKRGIKHPYVKSFVLARTTPLTRARKTLPSFEVTFRKLTENLEAFDVTKIRYEEIARSALMAAPAAG